MTEPDELSLIVRLPNWVGDVIMALPALEAMKQLGVKLQLFGKPWAKPLLAGTGLDVFPITDSFWRNTFAMHQLRTYQKTLLLTNSISSAVMSYLAGKKTIGYKNDFRELLLKRSLAKPSHHHEVQHFWNMAQFACQYWFPNIEWPKTIPSQLTLPIRPQSSAKAHQILQQADIKGTFWVLCPFAQGKGAHGQSKIWPHWQALSTRLNEHPLVVCPGKNEEIQCASLMPKATILSGLNLEEYAAVLAKAEQVIANDSGPMHLSAAVNKKTLGIFGVTDPKRTHPWGGDYIGSSDRWPTLDEVLNFIKK
jgi:heptosyltransferase-2